MKKIKAFLYLVQFRLTTCLMCDNNLNWLCYLVLLLRRKWLKILCRGDFVAYKVIKCGDYRERRSFSRIRNTFYELNDLLEIQKKSYQ